MLRRTVYYNGEYTWYMILAGICGMMMLIAFVLFLYNIIMSIGLKGLVGIYEPSRIDTHECLVETKE